MTIKGKIGFEIESFYLKNKDKKIKDYCKKNKVTIDNDGSQKEYRKYLNVNVANEKGRFYVLTDNILKNPDLKSQILKKALSEVEYWQKSYQDYQELEDIFKGVKKTKKKLRKILVAEQ